MNCPNCGAPIENSACSYCGFKAIVSPSPVFVQDSTQAENKAQSPICTNSKSKTIALVLCIFLGVFGAHRFYVNKVTTGFLYFFTGGLFIFGWLFDIILIATGGFKDKSGNFLS